MQISPLTIYAIQTLRTLNKTSLSNEGIAKRLDISFPYALKVTNALRQAGVIASSRVDGYSLTCPLDEIPLDEVIAATEGLIANSEKDTKPMAKERDRLRRAVAEALRQVGL